MTDKEILKPGTQTDAGPADDKAGAPTIVDVVTGLTKGSCDVSRLLEQMEMDAEFRQFEAGLISCYRDGLNLLLEDLRFYITPPNDKTNPNLILIREIKNYIAKNLAFTRLKADYLVNLGSDEEFKSVSKVPVAVIPPHHRFAQCERPLVEINFNEIRPPHILISPEQTTSEWAGLYLFFALAVSYAYTGYLKKKKPIRTLDLDAMCIGLQTSIEGINYSTKDGFLSAAHGLLDELNIADIKDIILWLQDEKNMQILEDKLGQIICMEKSRSEMERIARHEFYAYGIIYAKVNQITRNHTFEGWSDIWAQAVQLYMLEAKMKKLIKFKSELWPEKE